MKLSDIEEMVRELYEDDRDKLGYPAIEHIVRVAHGVESMPWRRPSLKESAVRVAWLHDTVEDGKLSHLQAYDLLSRLEFYCLLLLTRDGKGTYMDYIRRLRDAPGQAGQIVRSIKRVDLMDNMSRPCPPNMTGMREPGGRYWRAYRVLEAQ